MVTYLCNVVNEMVICVNNMSNFVFNIDSSDALDKA